MSPARLLVCCGLLASAAGAQINWPPSLDVSVHCGDVVGLATLTVRGVWNDSCIPRRLEAQLLTNATVLVTVYHDVPPGPFCLTVLTPYTLTTEIILPDGDYPALVELISPRVPNRPPLPFGDIRIRCLPRCIADFNEDGGIDGADVEAFFIAWESADPSADTNSDGGIDGADVEAFFQAWESGSC